MGQVCTKHQQFYETECRWCEPEGLTAVLPHGAPSLFGIDSVISVFAGAISQRAAKMEANKERNEKLLQLACNHACRSTTRDACDICGMSGLEMLQRASTRYVPIE